MAITAQAEIYTWTDSNGKVHYSDTAPEGQQTKNVSFTDINTYADVSISDAPDWVGFYKPEERPRTKPVVMYTTQQCGYCKKARNYFNRRGIAFTEKKVDQDRDAWAEYQKLDATGVPVILIGRKRMNGFSEARFDKLFYGENGAP